jgi:hypothetical protein
VWPVSFISPAPSIHRAAVSIVQSTDRFLHQEAGIALAALFIILVTGVGASRTSQTISPGAATVTQKRRWSVQSIRIGSVAFSVIAAPK